MGGLQRFYLSRFRGWQPIGTESNPFNAHFKGNGHKLSLLQINRNVDDRINIGLFAVIGPNGRVEGLGLENPAIQGFEGNNSEAGSNIVPLNIGSIAGSVQRGGVIANSYAISVETQGDSEGQLQLDSFRRIRGDKDGAIGGLVGENSGYILNSYTNINVGDAHPPERGTDRIERNSIVGGLVGREFERWQDSQQLCSRHSARGGVLWGGLAGIQETDEALVDVFGEASEIRNSYMSGEVNTGIGGSREEDEDSCSDSDNKIAGIGVARNIHSIIKNSYAKRHNPSAAF